jgi:hypothetical protein
MDADDSTALLDKTRTELRRATAALARNKRERNLATDPIRSLILDGTERKLRADVVVARIKFDIVKDLLASGEPLDAARFDEISLFMATVARTYKQR